MLGSKGSLHCVSSIVQSGGNGNSPDLDLGSNLGKSLGEFLVNTLLNKDSGTGAARLTAVEKDTLSGVFGSFLEVGIVENNVGAFTTELKRDLL